MIECKDCIKWSRKYFLDLEGVGHCVNHSPVFDKKTGSEWPRTAEDDGCFDAIPKPELRN